MEHGETGFYYLQSRYYDTEVCRFINADGYLSTGQGVLGNNMYAYCGNNPVIRKDPNGQEWFTITLIIAVVVVVVGVVGGKTMADNAIDNSGANNAEKALAKKDYYAAYQANRAKIITEDYVTRIYGRQNDIDDRYYRGKEGKEIC